MRTFHYLFASFCVALFLVMSTATAIAQQSTSASTATKPAELTPANEDISVGQKVRFSAVVKDASGNKTNAPASAWFAAPFDLAGVDESGTVSFFSPGEVLVGAIVGGKTVLTHVMVKPGPVTRIDLDRVKSSLVVGATTKLSATARSAEGNPRSDVSINWTSSKPDVATVDGAGVVMAVAPGQTTISAASGSGSGSTNVTVVKGSLTRLSIDPRSEEHTSELQSRGHLVCRLLLE